MTVSEMIAKLQALDAPDAEVGAMTYDVTGWVAGISKVGLVEEDGKTVAVIGQSKHDGTLFADEVGQPAWV